MSTPAVADARPPEGLTFLGHPISLFVLFFSEFWERFSFYGMKALLTLYMIKALQYGDDRAYGIYGTYTSLVYATPLLGGLIADQLLGYRRAILLGGVLMALGHFAMAFENENAFFLALSLLILGNGFFKPNISSLVGKLYAEDDPRRDSAFTIFYMGINAGAGLAPLLCAGLADYYATRDASGEIVERAWNVGFGLAGVGMVLGLVTFVAFKRHLGEHGLPPSQEKLTSGPAPGLTWERITYIVPFLVLPALFWLVAQEVIVGWVLSAVGVVTLAGLLYTAFTSEKVERERMFVVIVLIFFSMLFWAFFEQAGSSVNVFTDRNVDRHVGGFDIPTEWFQSVNPFFIILLAPVFAALWARLAKAHRDPASPVKFGLGILQLALGFACLWYGASTAGENGIVGISWLVLGYLFHTTGELCLSPVGLSMVTRLSPARIVGVVMGAWFLATAFSQYVASMIAKLTGAEGGGDEAAKLLPPETIDLYTPVFGWIALAALVAGVLCLAIAPILKTWMHEDKLGQPATGSHT